MGGYTAVCSVRETDDADPIRKNYAVELADGRTTGLVEKPERRAEPVPAVGRISSPDIFRDAHETPRRRVPTALSSLTSSTPRSAAPVLPFVLTGHYPNVN